MAASDIRREDVVKAIAEYERLGQSAFLTEYDHGEARRFRLVYEGKFYDSKAIVGVAHGYATGQFWNRDNLSGGMSSGQAGAILKNLGFFVDDGTLYFIEEINPDMTHGKRAPYQYIVALWAFARARDHQPRIVPFNDVRKELIELLGPFAVAKTVPDPAMPWAALGNREGFWELERRDLSTVTGTDVKQLNLSGGLFPGPYETAEHTLGFIDVAAQVVARFIGDEPAFPELLAELGIEVVGGQFSAEVADVVSAVDEVANPRRKFGRRLSAAENKAIEERAVEVVRQHFENVLGYETKDVGAYESYDVHAMKADSVIKVEVKGTTSDGSEIVLTANEVDLHLAEHPNNALAVVRRIVLDRSCDPPVGTGGELELVQGWELDESRLKPIAFRYTTGF